MRSVILFSLLSGVFTTSLVTGSSRNIPFSDRAVTSIRKLIACDLIDDAVLGQSPWTQVEVERLIQEAEKNISERPVISCGPAIAEVLSELKNCFGETKTIFHPLLGAHLTWLSHDSLGRSAKVSPPGNVDAILNPLLDNRSGRQFGKYNVALETLHAWDPHPLFSVFLQPRLLFREPFSQGESLAPSWQKVYTKGEWGNLEWEIGRDELISGYGRNGGTLFSENPRPLDQVRLRSVSPFLFPSFLKALGPSQTTLFITDLGQDREYPNAFLYGMLLNIRPHPRFELGFGHAITLGGKGAPAWEWIDIPLEFFFLRRGGLVGEQAGVGASPADHRSVFSFHYRPSVALRPEIYGEMFWDDTGFSQIVNHLKYRTGWQIGIFVPWLSSDGSDELRFEYLSLPSYAYHHTYYSSGYVLNHRLIGASPGPASREFSVAYHRRFLQRHEIEALLGYQYYDGNSYQFDGSSYERTLLQSGLSEERYRLGVTYSWRFQESWVLGVEANLEKIIHFNFQPESRTQSLFSLTVSYRP